MNLCVETLHEASPREEDKVQTTMRKQCGKVILRPQFDSERAQIWSCRTKVVHGSDKPKTQERYLPRPPCSRFFASIVTKPIRTIGRKNDLEVWGFDAVYLSLPKTEENRSWLLVSGASQVKIKTTIQRGW